MIKKYIIFLICIILAVAVLACNQTDSELPSVETPAQDSPLQEGEPNKEPTPTEASAVDPEPISSPTNSPKPTLTPDNRPKGLNPDGPYIIYKGTSGIWISNPDGSFPKQLHTFKPNHSINHTVSPDGKYLALVVRKPDGLDLEIIKIPGGETRIATRLLSFTVEQANDVTGEKAFVRYALLDYPAVAWQPDGDLLAFMGAINGPTSDLYTYNMQTEEIIQLTDGPAQGIVPIWSPDGEYILHFGVSWEPPFGGAIGGANTVRGAWAARAADGEIITLPKPKWPASNFFGWEDDHTYIAALPSLDEDGYTMQAVNVETGEKVEFSPHTFYNSTLLIPDTHALVFANSEDDNNGIGEGVFFLDPGDSEPVKISDEYAWEFHLLAGNKIFWSYDEGLFTVNGQTFFEPPVFGVSFDPAVSWKGYEAWEVIENQQGRVMVRTPGSDWQTILEASVNALLWNPDDGTSLIIVTSKGLIYSAVYPDFEPELMGDLDGSYFDAFRIP